MTIFSSEYWTDTESQVNFIKSTFRVKNLIITAVKLYLIQDDKLLLVRVNSGWDLPGGHVEKDEKPDDAILREVKEETGGEIDNYIRIGYLKIEKVKKNVNNIYYPDKSGIQIYASKNIEFDKNFDLNQFEAYEHKFIRFTDLSKYHHNWTELKKQILRYAVKKLNHSIS